LRPLIEVNAAGRRLPTLVGAPSTASGDGGAALLNRNCPSHVYGEVRAASSHRGALMSAFVYHCPNMGKLVQGWTAEDPYESEADEYEPVRCIACMRVHMANPKTGKVLGADEPLSAPPMAGPNRR
jgi:hypothetical protein